MSNLCKTVLTLILFQIFEQMNPDEKLSPIFSTLTCNQNKIIHIEQKVNNINMLNGKMARAETVMHSYNDRLKLLEYRSIDLEARSQRNNLLFKGFPESRDENCRRTVCGLLEDKLGMEELPTIERAYRLGRFNPAKGPRPIIVAFSFIKDTEDILSAARSLRGTPYGISRDFPPEITKARQVLCSQFKEARGNPLNRVTIAYPAKLIVNSVIVCDFFSDWDIVMKGSRISLPKQSNEHLNTHGATYASVVNLQSNGYQHDLRSNVVETYGNSNSPVPFTPIDNNTEEMKTQEIHDPQSSPSLLSGAAGTDLVREFVTENVQNEGEHDCNASNLSGSDKNKHGGNERRVVTDRTEDQSKENTLSLDRSDDEFDDNIAKSREWTDSRDNGAKGQSKPNTNENSDGAETSSQRRISTELSLSPVTLADKLIQSATNVASTEMFAGDQRTDSRVSRKQQHHDRTSRSSSRSWWSESKARYKNTSDKGLIRNVNPSPNAGAHS